MDQERSSRDRAPDRVRRQDAGQVAQYIHELSQRHAVAREAAPGTAGAAPEQGEPGGE